MELWMQLFHCSLSSFESCLVRVQDAGCDINAREDFNDSLTRIKSLPQLNPIKPPN